MVVLFEQLPRISPDWIIAEILPDCFKDQATRLLASSSNLSSLHPVDQIARLQLKQNDVLLDEFWLIEKIAQRLHIDYTKISKISLNIEAEKYIYTLPENFARNYFLAILEINEKHIRIAHSFPDNLKWIDLLKQKTFKHIQPVLAAPRVIQAAIDEFYSVSAHIFSSQKVLGDIAQLESFLWENEADISDSSIQKLLHNIVRKALEQKASDIHGEIYSQFSQIRMRFDGYLVKTHEFSPQLMTLLLNKLKISASMDTTETRCAQDGSFQLQLDEKQQLDIRMSSIPTKFGEKFVLRILGQSSHIKSFSDLQMDPGVFSQWNKLLKLQHGLILVVGPTGSGKTTSLYTSIQSLLQEGINICTIEDPIEAIIEGVNQVEVNEAIGFSFAKGLRAILRQDPDILLIGEIRDKETAQIAVQAALTGHLVFATLHTNDCVQSLLRLLDLGLPAYLIRNALKGVLAQRLIRLICPECKQSSTISNCHTCKNTGFVGRSAIFECMLVDSSLENLIEEDMKTSRIYAELEKTEFISLHQAADQLLEQGKTTRSEIESILGANL